MNKFRISSESIKRISRVLFELGKFARVAILKRRNPQNNTDSSSFLPAVVNTDPSSSRFSDAYFRLREHGILGSKLAVVSLVIYRTYSMGVWSDIETTNLLAADIHEQLLELVDEFVEERNGSFMLFEDKDRPVKVDCERSKSSLNENSSEESSQLPFAYLWNSLVINLFSGLSKTDSSVNQVKCKMDSSGQNFQDDSSQFENDKN